MSSRGVENFGAWQKARRLFDWVAEDIGTLQQIPACWKLVSQQIASADSVCANIEEGYGRGSKKDYARFLLFARGSALETRGRYDRLTHWLPADQVAERIALCDEIIAILTTTIATLRKDDHR